ncbi:HAD-IB family hydrolase [Candidatus Woesearchaeota archaeon]|nr:HAD-IB family hydrolase [Candidatus Woesearchaeota archaeon]
MAGVAFFDVDNTIIDGNSTENVLVHQFCRFKISLLSACVGSFAFIWHRLGILNFDTVKLRLGAIVRGWDYKESIRLSESIFNNKTKKRIRPKIKKLVEQHKKKGKVILLSNSPEMVLKPLGDFLSVEVRGARLEVIDGKFTGRFLRTCYGKEKAMIMKAYAKKRKIDLSKSYFYTDSYSDLTALESVGNPIVVNPDGLLLDHAKKKGWKIIWP